MQLHLRWWWSRSCQVQSFSVNAYRTCDVSLAVQHARRYRTLLLTHAHVASVMYIYGIDSYSSMRIDKNVHWAAHSRAKWSGASFRISAFTYGRCLRHTCNDRGRSISTVTSHGFVLTTATSTAVQRAASAALSRDNQFRSPEQSITIQQ